MRLSIELHAICFQHLEELCPQLGRVVASSMLVLYLGNPTWKACPKFPANTPCKSCWAVARLVPADCQRTAVIQSGLFYFKHASRLPSPVQSECLRFNNRLSIFSTFYILDFPYSRWPQSIQSSAIQRRSFGCSIRTMAST